MAFITFSRFSPPTLPATKSTLPTFSPTNQILNFKMLFPCPSESECLTDGKYILISVPPKKVAYSSSELQGVAKSTSSLQSTLDR